MLGVTSTAAPEAVQSTCGSCITCAHSNMAGVGVGVSAKYRANEPAPLQLRSRRPISIRLLGFLPLAAGLLIPTTLMHAPLFS
jgi:hypothetical protein